MSPHESIASSSWYIVVNDKKVGTLSNGYSEVQSEFWTVYDMQLTNATYNKLATDEDSWISLSVFLENQSNPSIIIKSFLVSLRPEGKIAIRILLD